MHKTLNSIKWKKDVFGATFGCFVGHRAAGFQASFRKHFLPSLGSFLHPFFFVFSSAVFHFIFMCSDIRTVSEGSILFTEEEIKLWLWPRCLWRQSRGSVKLGSARQVPHSPFPALLFSPLRLSTQYKGAENKMLLYYSHSTKLEESKFPSARRREGSGGNGSVDWLIQEQWWNSL